MTSEGAAGGWLLESTSVHPALDHLIDTGDVGTVQKEGLAGRGTSHRSRFKLAWRDQHDGTETPCGTVTDGVNLAEHVLDLLVDSEGACLALDEEEAIVVSRNHVKLGGTSRHAAGLPRARHTYG